MEPEPYSEQLEPRTQSLRCAGCRITIRAERVIVGDRDFCCEGCAAGGPCCC